MQHKGASRSRERDGSSSAAYAGRMSAVSLTRSCFPRRDLTLMNLVTLPASAHAYTRRTVCTKSCRTGCRQSRNGKSLRCRFGAAASKTASFSTACGSQSTTRTWRRPSTYSFSSHRPHPAGQALLGGEFAALRPSPPTLGLVCRRRRRGALLVREFASLHLSLATSLKHRCSYL